MRTPLPTLMTVAVIGMALALPAGLYALTRNLSALGAGWEQTAGLSLFLRAEVTETRAAALAKSLRQHPQLREVRVIGPEEGLMELREAGVGFADAIGLLGENPLPWVLGVQPAADVSTPEAAERLRDELATIGEVELARLDTLWMRRFQAVVDLIRQGVLILGGGLALAVLLVVGNTIRLEIENRRGEIEIMELVGATHAFIRRPFLYAGAWYGLLGGLAAWLLTTIGLLLLQGPVSRLAAMYDTQFPLAGLGPLALLALLGGSALLGLLGSWVSVNRHLAAIEPH